MSLKPLLLLPLALFGIEDCHQVWASNPPLSPQESYPSAADLLPAPERIKEIRFLFVDQEGKPIEQTQQHKTNTDYLLGELQQRAGQVYSSELLRQDLWRLQRLDLFRQVNFSLDKGEDGVVITYQLQEKNFSRFVFGGGNSGDLGLYGKIGYRHTNISGVNDRLKIDLQGSPKDIQYQAGFTSPYRKFEPARLGYTVEIFRSRDFSSTFNKDVGLVNGDDIREGKWGATAGILKSFGKWDSQLALNYTRISLRNRDWQVSNQDQFGNPLSLSNTGIDDLFTVSLGMTLDQRNRASDAFEGYLLSLSTEQSIPVGLGEVFMNRLKANYIHYFPIHWLGTSQMEPEKNPELAEVLAINLQAGAIFGDVIPAQSFNLGGLNSVRGYGGGDLASGRNFLLGTMEYRFPFSESLGAVIFSDFGTDFGSGETILGQPGPVRNKPGTGFGYGIGLRVKSPLGLIRGDLGINDQGNIRFEITTGQRF